MLKQSFNEMKEILKEKLQKKLDTNLEKDHLFEEESLLLESLMISPLGDPSL